MKNLTLILALFLPLSILAQTQPAEETKLTEELKSYLDDFSYQVVMFKYGTIIPVKTPQDNLEEFAILELQNAAKNVFGDAPGTHFSAFSPHGMGFMIVFDTEDVRNCVTDGDHLRAMLTASRNRKLDAEKPEIVYVSK